MKPAEQPKKKKKVWLIVLLCILGLLLAAVLTVYGIFHSKYSQIYEPETTPAATPAATNGTPATEPDYEEIVDASEESIVLVFSLKSFKYLLAPGMSLLSKYACNPI